MRLFGSAGTLHCTRDVFSTVSTKDRRKADPETDGEFLDPADVENPAEPKLPPFQVRLMLGDVLMRCPDLLAASPAFF